MNTHSYDSFIRDSDDICHVAVTLIKWLFGEGNIEEFRLEILQVISMISEPIIPKKAEVE
jgi:hypothetical protein